MSCLSQAHPRDTIPPSKDENGQFLEENIRFDELPEVIVYPKKEGLYKEPISVEKTYYYFLQKKVYNVYPYAKTAVILYNQSLEEFSKIYSKREKRRYFYHKIKELEVEYEKQLMKFTKKEGQLFSKLINRQTQKTTYEIIRQFRSEWSAFWWNLKANFYKISLKTPYDPDNDPEDHFIEIILQQAFHNGELSP